jgi:Ca2+:H+ antiporter
MKLSLQPSFNWLFAFIPVTVALEHAGKVSSPVVFFSAALAIIPIARLIVQSTEQISTRTGDAVGGLLNSTFGNAPELIIALVALRAGYFDMVRASLIGAILANLLLALGIAFLLGGFRHHTQQYNPGAARAYSTMMLISVISLGVPSAFSRFFAPTGTIRQEQLLNVGTAIVLLLAYGLYLVFALKSHPDFFASVDLQEQGHHEGERWGMPRAIGSLVAASVLAAWMSEILVGAAAGTGEALGMSQTFIGIVFLAIVGGAAESGSAVAMARKSPDSRVGHFIRAWTGHFCRALKPPSLSSGPSGPWTGEIVFSFAELGSKTSLWKVAVSGGGKPERLASFGEAGSHPKLPRDYVAKLLGFERETRDGLIAADLQHQHLEFVLRTGLKKLARNGQACLRGRNVHIERGPREPMRVVRHVLGNDDLVTRPLERVALKRSCHMVPHDRKAG